MLTSSHREGEGDGDEASDSIQPSAVSLRGSNANDVNNDNGSATTFVLNLTLLSSSSSLSDKNACSEVESSVTTTSKQDADNEREVKREFIKK